MAGESFQTRHTVHTRGDIRRARVRLHLRRGVTLVELMLAMLILTIVCVAWLEIIGVQSARREARRREAVERLAGMMDAFMYENRKNPSLEAGCYNMETNELHLSFSKATTDSNICPVYSDGSSPIGYQLLIVANNDSLLKDMGMPQNDWKSNYQNKKWLVGRLYDRHGDVVKDDVGEPFFVLPVYLGL